MLRSSVSAASELREQWLRNHARTMAYSLNVRLSVEIGGLQKTLKSLKFHIFFRYQKRFFGDRFRFGERHDSTGLLNAGEKGS